MVTLQTGNNNIYIGNQGARDESQTIRIGTAQGQTFIAGINVAGVSGATVVVDGNGQLGVAFASARYKQNIAAMGNRSEKVLDLRPVTFSYKDDAHQVSHYGLIAEEVATVLPELVTRTATGEVQTVKYQELIPMLLNELQRQELAELRALVGQGRGAEAVIPKRRSRRAGRSRCHSNRRSGRCSVTPPSSGWRVGRWNPRRHSRRGRSSTVSSTQRKRWKATAL